MKIQKNSGLEDKKQKEVEYIYWNENAENNYRIKNGEIVIRNNAVVKILGSELLIARILDTQRSIYCYEGINISETEEGKKALDKYSQHKERSLIELEKKKTSIIQQIEDVIRNNDLLQHKKTSMPKGNVIYDTRSIFGDGECIITDSEYAWYIIINNGADGDDSRNHILTRGAVGYGYQCEIEKIQELWQQLNEIIRSKKFMDRKKESTKL